MRHRIPTSPVRDAELMRRMCADDTEAFAVFYDRHVGSVFGIALHLLRDRAAAEDVAQETFLSVWRARHRYRPERSAPRTWLLTIARNRAIDHARRRPRLPDQPLEPHHLEREAGPDHPEDLVLRAAAAADVRHRLRELPDAQRHVIELAYFAGLTQAELADHLGIPLGTVKGRMRLGMQKLAAQMDPAGVH